MDQKFEDTVPGIPVNTDGYTYGYVFFRQQSDDEIKRGFFQKSLVLLSPHPWPGMFCRVVELLGPELMNSLVRDRRESNQEKATAGIALLEAASFNIAAWPPLPSSLSPGSSFAINKMALAFLGFVEHFTIPPEPNFPQMFDHQRTRQYSGSTMTPKFSICNPGNFYQIFSGQLENMWTCWELMTVGEPILVFGSTPKSCAQVVWALTELIKPVVFIDLDSFWWGF